jgi:hypothetical protein
MLLMIHDGGGISTAHPLNKDAGDDVTLFCVGRDARLTDVRVDHTRVSAVHMYIAIHGQFAFVLDADSVNGTFVDGARARPYVLTPIKEDSVISIGNNLAYTSENPSPYMTCHGVNYLVEQSRAKRATKRPRRAVTDATLLETVTCDICTEYLALPTTTTCGHTFCLNCIVQHRNAAGKGMTTRNNYAVPCPTCRSKVGTLSRSFAMERATEALLERFETPNVVSAWRTRSLIID